MWEIWLTLIGGVILVWGSRRLPDNEASLFILAVSSLVSIMYWLNTQEEYLSTNKHDRSYAETIRFVFIGTFWFPMGSVVSFCIGYYGRGWQ